MKNFHQLKLDMEAAIDGMLVNEISEKFIVDITKVFNF